MKIETLSRLANFPLDVAMSERYELVFLTSQPQKWTCMISQKFELSDLETTILSSYLHHIHPESLKSFSEKLLSSPRSYLEPFIDNELEEFGDEMFTVDYDDLFDESPSGSRGRLVLYNAFVQNLKEMSKDDRTKQYKALNISFFPKEDKKTRRIKLYSSFVNALRKMSKEKFSTYQDIFVD